MYNIYKHKFMLQMFCILQNFIFCGFLGFSIQNFYLCKLLSLNILYKKKCIFSKQESSVKLLLFSFLTFMNFIYFIVYYNKYLSTYVGIRFIFITENFILSFSLIKFEKKLLVEGTFFL